MRAAITITITASLALVALSATPAVAQDARDEARDRFARGLRLYEEGRDEAALAELEEAYRLSPAWQVLYNIGRVHARLGRAVEAADAFERYLRDGGGDVPADRRAEVEGRREEQRARIARVTIETNAPRAVIMLDGADFARAPLDAPLRIAAGMHTIGARAEGYGPVTERVRLAGGVDRHLRLELPREVEERARLRIRASAPDVTVFIDGEEVGRTPMDDDVALAPGEHVVEGRRAGYLTARDLVSASAGQSLESHLVMRANEDAPTAPLRLRLPDAAGTVFVDGDALTASAAPIDVIEGQHRLRVEIAGRRPLEETVRVSPEGLDYAPALVWEDDARQARLDAAAAQRAAGWVLIAVGAGAVAAGAAWAAIGAEVNAVSQEERDLFDFCEGQRPAPVECRAPIYDRESILQRMELADVNLGVGLGVAGLGVVAALVGLPLALAAPSDDDVEREARVVVRLGLGSASVAGTFH